MTRISSHPNQLIDAVAGLISEYAPSDLSSADVLGAVARAELHVRDGFGVIGLDMPPEDEYAVLVVGLARQELALRIGAIRTAPRPHRE